MDRLPPRSQADRAGLYGQQPSQGSFLVDKDLGEMASVRGYRVELIEFLLLFRRGQLATFGR